MSDYLRRVYVITEPGWTDDEIKCVKWTRDEAEEWVAAKPEPERFVIREWDVSPTPAAARRARG